MPEENEPQAEPVFRANKRRKVYRKRNADNEDEDVSEPHPVPEQQTGDDEQPHLGAVRKPVIKKHGIGFSSSGKQATPTPGDSETALVPIQKDLGELAQNDRFTRPTGKATPVEDKHLTAYVDSKLAELRSSTIPPVTQHNGAGSSTSPEDARESNSTSSSMQPTPSMSDRQAQIQRHQSRHQPKKPKRRQPAARDEADIARDALVDQILGESSLSVYDRPTTSTASNATPSRDLDSAEEIDNDEAAARAFKEQFLANLAQNNRRKPPALPADKKGVEKTSHGPKLGGSRSQREKMKALEEARNAAGGAGSGSGSGRK